MYIFLAAMIRCVKIIVHMAKKTYPLADEQILRLDVSVDHMLRVAIVQRNGQVVNISTKKRIVKVG